MTRAERGSGPGESGAAGPGGGDADTGSRADTRSHAADSGRPAARHDPEGDFSQDPRRGSGRSSERAPGPDPGRGKSDHSDLFTLVPGDNTRPDMGMSQATRERLRHEVTHVFHLAAIYDLAVGEAAARAVNVTGTNHVNQWVATLPNVSRYVYFSTAYVAGRRQGVVLETELAMGQDFKNHYERTKFEAEALVQALAGAVPTTVIRPGVTRGHSETGETIKFDGPYFILNMFDRLRLLPFLPYLGRGDAKFNTVPSDYVVNAAVYLGHADAGRGKTYHLTDPRPYPMRDVYRMLLRKSLGRAPFGTLPLWLVDAALRIGPLRRWLRIEREALDYTVIGAEFDTTQATTDLRGSGIECPDFKDTLTAMVHYYVAHKDDQGKQLKIR